MGDDALDRVVARAVEQAAPELERWGLELCKATEGLDQEKSIASALDKAAERIDLTAFVETVAHALIESVMLGASDSYEDSESDETVTTITASRAKLLQSSQPFEAAIDSFAKRKILPKELFEQLQDKAKRKAFTVAGLASEELLGDAHAELLRQLKESKEKTYFDEATQKWVYKGPDLRQYSQFAKKRLESAGWTPANPSHVETILRTNVATAYSSGRFTEMTQPSVIKHRPYWQIVGVNDSRQRPTHRKAQNTILPADDPFWRSAYPPFGYCCRCRVVSRSKRWVDAHGGPTRAPLGLPDPGFRSGMPTLLIPGKTEDIARGMRGPTAPRPAHPNTPPPLPPSPLLPTKTPPVVVPIDLTPPKPALIAPTLDITPRKPDPPVATSFTVGVHVRTIRKSIAAKKAQALLSTFTTEELRVLRKQPLDHLVFERSGFGKGGGVVGEYGRNLITGDDQIRIAGHRPPNTYGEKLVVGKSWSISETKKTEIEAIQSTLHHEFGHLLHRRGGPAADEIVKRSFAKGKPVTRYGAKVAHEYFAESYSAYRSEPEFLKLHDPVGYDMVTKVLYLSGIAHD